MNEIDKILDMIKAVEPDDTETLNEIDARVWCLYNNAKYIQKECGLEFVYKDNIGQAVARCHAFTRSIDAQKALEEDGWYLFQITHYGCLTSKRFWKAEAVNSNKKTIAGAGLPTEPLARLYCWLSVRQFETEKEKP